jgi:hypothetical protein
VSEIHPDDAYLDPLVELERLIVERTCETCGAIIPHMVVYSRMQERRFIPSPRREWRCVQQPRNGYVFKHWRYWLLCSVCKSQGFARWIFPVIQNMPPIVDLRHLVSVQPMNEPAAQVFYMDFMVGPEGVRLGQHNPPREGALPLP